MQKKKLVLMLLLEITQHVLHAHSSIKGSVEGVKEISPLKICYMSQVWFCLRWRQNFCLVVFDCSREDFEIF